MPKYILSIYCGHDASATLLRDGEIAVSILQERLDRIKHSNATGRELTSDTSGEDYGFPWETVRYCLEAEGIGPSDVDIYTTNYHGHAPVLGKERYEFPQHHLCHAALAFYTSGTKRCVILVIDYVGDTILLEHDQFLGYERESAWLGDETGLSLIWRHLGNNRATLFGIGCVYNQVASYLFGHGDPEGKLMALAALGQPNSQLSEPFFILEAGQVYVKPSPLFREKRQRPPWMPADRPHYECELDWGVLPPSPTETGEISQFHRDLAARLQNDLEEAVIYVVQSLRRITGARHLALSGGVALNCLANMRVAERAGFDRVYVPSAPGDSGQATGAALYIWHQTERNKAAKSRYYGYCGRAYSESEIETALRSVDGRISYSRSLRIEKDVAQRVASGEIVAWFQGRSEAGPRALGSRSILADPRNASAIERLNAVVKRREWFQPIAPSVLAEECERYFAVRESPFMCFAAPAKEEARSRAPGIVHADGTARVHTVSREANPLYHSLLSEFRELTGLPVIANTSFNGKGEPIVETPQDAINSLLRMHFDALAIGPFLVRRTGTGLV